MVARDMSAESTSTSVRGASSGEKKDYGSNSIKSLQLIRDSAIGKCAGVFFNSLGNVIMAIACVIGVDCKFWKVFGHGILKVGTSRAQDCSRYVSSFL